MTVVVPSTTDPGIAAPRWTVPPDALLNHTAIPRGLRFYGGQLAVAALGAADQTLVFITLTFPTTHVYLPKSLNVRFESDDMTSEFENFGSLTYNLVRYTGPVDPIFGLFSRGICFQPATALATNIYHPEGTWRQWINGPDGDTIVLNIADVSGDTSAAGDAFWSAEFWEYDIEQCLNWEPNLQQQLIGP